MPYSITIIISSIYIIKRKINSTMKVSVGCKNFLTQNAVSNDIVTDDFLYKKHYVYIIYTKIEIFSIIKMDE